MKFGRFLALANAALITTKHIDFNASVSRESQDAREACDASHDADGYPPNGFDEVPEFTEQCFAC